MDKIIIEDLEVYAYHGVAKEEKKLGQLFLISLHISTDLEWAAVGDNLDSTINYAQVCDTVKEVLQAEKYDLIETAAMKVIEEIFKKFSSTMVVKVLLKKPWAPMGHHLKFAAVELERARSDRNEW
ncbi:dihydroneopterin aldolase [Petroclostridium sp. X23]|uniref:dihydroneopterin aldolase n=1 Tax=Petroclostridium sp. X23 TaxID=3045146 RepID=UPI0024AD4F0D|nr:dihydroneopterin aldolase [Petroclostridium sp. X23]WHH60228.1 dihydroneopterin aldolase [Petroclostridium sp. X23]